MQGQGKQSVIITERDCSGQARLVREKLKQLNVAIEDADGPKDMSKAQVIALELANELSSYQVMCLRCRGDES